MFYRRENLPRFRVVLWYLIVDLLAGIGSTQGLSLISILIDGSHEVFLAEKVAGTCLILHHPGYQDEHEPSFGRLAKSQGGVLDKLLTAGREEAFAPDHKFYLSNPEQQITPATSAKPAALFKITSPSTTAQKALTSVHLFSADLSPPAPFYTSTALLSLRAPPFF